MSNLTPKRGEIKSLTGIRGVAACYVMLYHFAAGFGPGPVKEFTQHGYISVDLFFVLSGFVMALTYAKSFRSAPSAGEYGKFLYSRIARVYPLYLIAILVAFTVYKLQGLGPTITGPKVLALNLLLVQAWGFGQSLVGQSWSISTEFGAYFIFPFVVGAIIFGRPVWRWVAVLFSVATMLFVTSRTAAQLLQVGTDRTWRSGPLDIFGPGTAYPLLRCLAGFTVGILAYSLATNGPTIPMAARRYLGDVLGLAIFVLLFVHNSDLLIELLFVPLVIMLTFPHGLVERVLSHGFVHWLGVISYSIYLIHEYVHDLLKEPVRGFAAARHLGNPSAIHGAITMVVTVFAGAVTYYAIEQPARNLLRKALKKKPMAIVADPAAP